jgi:hypothetical protein
MERVLNMNSIGGWYPSIFTVFILVLVVVALSVTQQGYDTTSLNTTIDGINWTHYGQNVTKSIQYAADNSENEAVRIIFNIANKAIDFMGYAVLEVARLAMKLARDNPTIIHWKVLFWLIIASLFAPLIYPAFILIVSIVLIISEWLQVRKEKKALGLRKKVKRSENLER